MSNSLCSEPTEQVGMTCVFNIAKDDRAPKAQDADLKLYLLLECEKRMSAISASECFVSH